MRQVAPLLVSLALIGWSSTGLPPALANMGVPPPNWRDRHFNVGSGSRTYKNGKTRTRDVKLSKDEYQLHKVNNFFTDFLKDISNRAAVEKTKLSESDKSAVVCFDIMRDGTWSRAFRWQPNRCGKAKDKLAEQIADRLLYRPHEDFIPGFGSDCPEWIRVRIDFGNRSNLEGADGPEVTIVAFRDYDAHVDRTFVTKR